MKNSFIFALIVFSMLFIIPTVALNYLENKLDNINSQIIEDTTKPAPEQLNNNQNMQINSSESDLIKVYNLKTNEVIVIDFEEYLKGVVASEMPAEFNIEALKAQAVTARTYLLYKIKKFPNGQPEHLDAPVCTGTHCQVWNSKDDLIAQHENGWYDKYWGKIEEAVNSTRGQILTYENKIIEPLFHSTSGGRTENSEDVFSTSVPYLRSVESPYENNAPKLHDSAKIPISDFIIKLKSVYGDLNITPNNLKEKIQLGSVSEGGKIKSLIIDNQEISGREIRSLFSLNSTNFSFIQSGNQIEIVTTGYGHGVGMSQWGASGMADEGYNYKEILKHYYTNVEIANMK
ncbi:stage II sporulation protein D [Sedimentibacter acidaminivorans]|uniref:Stage II sporulation protein D n=1 Tax=Sedimentibacter acidaminivorans TaxID=913099 RepID=A0ABS4GGI0_9FIRM|nr:stage II sporulation protein D [Sedimentibacter acidaminivorans]MBP1926794.1 stage II sporulation protein D [Sedimentibacter acidaminivorans]